MAKSDDSFVARFERVMVGTDARIRQLEMKGAAMEQEITSLRGDRLDKIDVSIQELYESRNEMAKMVERLKGSALGLDHFCEKLEGTVERLGKQSALLSASEGSLTAQIEAITKLDAPARLQSLESSVETLEQGKTTRIKDTKWFLMLVIGAAVGAVATVVGKLIIWYLTKAG